jgi:4-amino-4-deoxy-L-arabinose transferase-like glycosyltransferase
VWLGNALAALAFLTHFAGIVWVAGVILAMVVLDRRRILSLKLLALGALPYLLAAVSWGIYIIQDFNAFREQVAGMLAVNENSFDTHGYSNFPILTHLELEVVSRYAAPFGLLPGVALASRLKILVLGMYLAGVFGILFIRRLRQNSELLYFSLLFLTAFFLLAEFSPSKFSYYLPHTTVILAACAGLFLYHLTPSPKWGVIVSVAAVLAAVQIGGSAVVIRRNEYRRTFTPVIQAVEQNSPPHSLVMSENEIWFGLWRNRTVLNDHRLGFLSGRHPDVIVMNTVYSMLHDHDRTNDPAEFQFAEQLIGKSRLVYGDDYSKVYVTEPQSAAANFMPAEGHRGQ